MTNGNDSAFTDATITDRGDTVRVDPCQSLTKREYFAAMALQGLLSDNVEGNYGGTDAVAIDAVRYADDLIEMLNKGGE